MHLAHTLEAMPRAAAPPLPLTEREREELLQVSKLRSTPQSVALRVQIVLRAAEGIANKVLARQLSTTLPTVLLWRGVIKRKGWREFWKIERAPVGPERFRRSTKPRLWRPPCAVLPKRPPIGVFVPWPKPRGSVVRACNASGKDITSNPIGWKDSNSAPTRSSLPKSGILSVST